MTQIGSNDACYTVHDGAVLSITVLLAPEAQFSFSYNLLDCVQPRLYEV